MIDTIINVSNVSMVFRMTSERITSLKEYVLKMLKKELRYNNFTALEDISFEVSSGEIFGIIGLNGSGKSTLLKILAGVLSPTTGKVVTRGSISPLIELGAGFDMELTARENIYLNGSMLGYTKAFMNEHFDEIINFAELWEFVDVPLKNYSSGMIARIGFAIATIVKPEILIVDEILAVGDFRFQAKCEERIGHLISGGTTVLIVSHSVEQIERLCTRAMWLKRGRMEMIGNTMEVCNSYKNS